jgi:tetratricopeptide (TPR) repeat protein
MAFGQPRRRARSLALVLAVVAGSAVPAVMVADAHRGNGGIDGLPLDDPWIHLTFARNLAESGSYSYFPGEPTLSGSTSPLYTLLLAAGFLVLDNEKLLSYLLGLRSHAGFLAALAVWARLRLRGSAWAAAAVLLVGLDGRIALLAVSGMETSLFLLLIALWTLERAGRLDDAEGAYRASLDLFPSQPEARLGLAGVLVRLGRLDEARESVAAIARDFPGHPAVAELARLLAAADSGD